MPVHFKIWYFVYHGGSSQAIFIRDETTANPFPLVGIASCGGAALIVFMPRLVPGPVAPGGRRRLPFSHCKILVCSFAYLIVSGKLFAYVRFCWPKIYRESQYFHGQKLAVLIRQCYLCNFLQVEICSCMSNYRWPRLHSFYRGIIVTLSHMVSPRNYRSVSCTETERELISAHARNHARYGVARAVSIGRMRMCTANRKNWPLPTRV